MTLIATTKRLILGAGPTGQAVARHLTQLGVDYEVADTRTSQALQDRFQAEFPDVTAYYGPLKTEYLDRFDEIIVSPGIAPHTDGLRETISPCISDIQLFRRAWPENRPLIAITGSNAKSTVTQMVGDILEHAGRNVLVGGNLGPQALDLLVDAGDTSIAVLELSSFQLARTEKLRATVATCLNMSPDHLDWHGDMVAYHKAKHRIFEGVGAIVVNAEDPLSQPLVPDQTPTIRFALQHSDFHRFGVIMHEDQSWIALGTEPWMPVAELPFSGDHMIQNAMAAMAIVHLLDVDPDCARAAIRNFKGLPHRMVDLGEYQGVRYINDSKGTNTGASIAAVKSVAATGPIHLLAGGDTKGAELGSWAQIMRQCTKRVYLYGADATRMQDALSDHALTFETLDEALAVARSEAAAGEIVLLSPAAASFDQFSDYQARGRHFEALVRGFHEA